MKNNIWIAGDFNCPKSNWTSLTCPENEKTSTNLLDLTKDFRLHQAVREPNRGKNILELSLTTNPSLIESTHSILLLYTNINLPKNQTRSPQMPLIQITVRGTEKLLKELKPNKVQVPDNIPARILKEMASRIAPILTIIFKKSINSGTAHFRLVESTYSLYLQIEPSPQTIGQSPSPVHHATLLNISYPHQSINILKATISSLTDNTASDLSVPVRLHCSQQSIMT